MAESAMSKTEAEIVLGLSEVSSYSYKEFNDAYRRAVKIHHPDAGGSNASMVRVNTAKKTIGALFVEDRQAVIITGEPAPCTSSVSSGGERWDCQRQTAAEEQRRRAEERARQAAEELRRQAEEFERERAERERAYAEKAAKEKEERDIKDSGPLAYFLLMISKISDGFWTVVSWAIPVGTFFVAARFLVPAVLGVNIDEFEGMSNAQATPVMFVVWVPTMLAWALRRKISNGLRKGFGALARMVSKMPK